MKNVQQRIALLAGVSVSAFGLAAPAAAATAAGIQHSVNDASVDDTLIISDIADDAAFYGVTVEDPASAFAIVQDSASGQILQAGNATTADVTLLATNGGDVTVGAIATAANTTGTATARGHVERGITQIGTAAKKASVELQNSGGLAVVADAHASGTAALALATMSTGILQMARGTMASAALTNQGEIDIDATAVANASAQNATALASMHGIAQTAQGTQSALVSLTNDGTISIDASASADGFAGGMAAANVEFGLWQSAAASGSEGFAGVSLDNSGTIAIDAHALASAQVSAAAVAEIRTAVYQHATGSGGGAAATLTNSGTMSFSASADANAHNDGARGATAIADAAVGGINQGAFAYTKQFETSSSGSTFHLNIANVPHGPASVGLTNSGTIAMTAAAHATGDDGGFAKAAVTDLLQAAIGISASVTLDNEGDISGVASAEGIGGQTAQAQAFAVGVVQNGTAWKTVETVTLTTSGAGHKDEFIGGVGPSSVSLTNSGSISLIANAHAEATATAMASSRSFAVAAATANVGGLGQAAWGTQATASIVNDGSIDLEAAAKATGLEIAVVKVDANGINQGAIATGFSSSANWTNSMFSASVAALALGPATAALDNSGALEIAAVGSAVAASYASVDMHEAGIFQIARGLTANAEFANSGTFEVSGSAHAVAQSELDFVFASGIQQWVKAASTAVASVDNSGTFAIHAKAQGTAIGGNATEIAIERAVEQVPSSLGIATASFANSGVVDLQAKSKATGGNLAFAGAFAGGIQQDPLFGTMNAKFDNSGQFLVAAEASADADAMAFGTAKATAYLVDAANVVLDVVNSGTITAEAAVVASGTAGSAHAFAAGFTMYAADHGTSGPAGLLSGTIANSGELNVSAKVISGNGGTNAATATGIFMMSTRNNATVVNSGLIDVAAITAGAPANAYGVNVVTGFMGDPATADDVFTFTNDGGTIVARGSTDGGDTWKRGMAVDVTNAPNASVINLVGDGAVYGNIAIKAGDEINVADGTTYFDGIINPASLPITGVHAADLDSGLAGVGTLNIQDSGNLVLADPKFTGNAAMYDGPAYALVDTLNMDAGGTLTFELQPASGGAQPAGSYPQVFADTANLDGTLVADVTTANGLFADSYSWNNVIDANTLNGKFDQCAVGGQDADSLLLTLSCSYDANANVDLALTRSAFDDVAGINRNALAVGSGLECIYDVGLTGGAAGMFADLFLITDAAKYNVALNQLSGSAYANYLNSFATLGAHYDDLVDHATDCDVPALGGSILECRADSPVHIWGQLDYQTRRADGDLEAGSTRSKRFTGQVGIDAVVGDAAIVGLEAGYVTNHLRDRQFGDTIEGKGAQAGVYAAYDPGAFFVKGMSTYSWFNGDSTRHVDFTGLATGATFRGTPTAHPDVNLWTFGLHGGARFAVGAGSVATPYLNLDHAMARLNGFTETGLAGANLSVESSHSNRTFLTGGVKWATQMGGVVPEVNLGYRYRFGNEGSAIDAFLAGDTDCDFDVVSAAQKKGSLLAGVSVGGRLGPVDLRIGYEGEFNGDVTSHSGNFKLVLPLGGHAAPRPAPMAVAPPPPVAAPAPAPVEAAPPPPPPPAPTERGERGR